jgi:hypothetical protein
MATTASIIIEVNEAGAVAKLAAVNAEAAKLGPTLQPVQHISEQTFNNIEGGALRARESAALLGEEFGVKIPRALRGTIAEAAGIGPIFSAAFSGLAIIGFTEIIIEAGKKVFEFYENVVNLKSEFEALDKIEKQLGQGLLSLSNELVNGNTRLIEFSSGAVAGAQARVAAFGLEIVDLGKLIDTSGKEFNDLGIAAKAALQEFLIPTQMKDLPDTLKNVGLEIKRFKRLLLNTDEGTTDNLALQEGLRALSSLYDTLSLKVQLFNQNVAIGSKETQEIVDREANQIAEEIRKIAKATEEASAKLQEMTSAANKAGLTGEAQITADAVAQMAKVEEIYSRQPTLAAEAGTAIAAIEAEASRKRIKLLTEEADKRFKIQDEEQDREEADAHAHAEKVRRMEDETINIERQAAIAMAPPWERANATIVADYQARMDKIREMQKTGDLDEEHAARQAAAAWTDAFAKMRDNLASDMETLFDNITSGNIGKYFLAQFKHMVFEMLATWILGMQGMRNASQQQMGSGGGILGSIFGGIFGGGGGFGGAGSGGGQGGIGSLPGVITNFAGGNGDFGGETSGPAFPGLAGIALSAGGGAGPGTTLPSGAGPGGAAGAAGLGAILAKVFPHGLKIGGQTFSGTALATMGISLGIDGIIRRAQGGGVLGVLEGAAGGAMTGFAFGGPIGAVIGGAIGLISSIFAGLFGQHKGDKARIQVMEPLIAQIKVIKDSYDVFQTDYNTGVGELETLRAQSLAALKQIGGRQVTGNSSGTNKLIDDAETYMKTIEAERARRAQIQFGPPQFRVGGFVGPELAGPMPSWFAGTAMHFADGGAVPAILHRGEFVMRPEAVSRIGVGNLANMNAGGSGGEVHNHFYINAIDTEGFDEFLSRGGMAKIVRQHRRGQSEGSW